MEAKCRSEAKERGLREYNTGVPCSQGHHSPRRTASGNCIECMRLFKKEYKKSPGGIAAKRKEISTIQHKARKAVGNAIQRGALKALPCEVCGSTINIHAHHEDYSKKLDVMWLCIKHHVERHDYLKRIAKYSTSQERPTHD